jgi:hypothetical protein
MNMFKGLMFLDGHFTRPEDLEEPRAEYGAHTAAADFGPQLGNRAASASWLARQGRRARSTTDSATGASAASSREISAKRAAFVREQAASVTPAQGPGLLDQLFLLGGRPMHAGHNLDLDEPFELPAAANASPERATAKRDRRGNQRRVNELQAQACNG